MKPILFSTSMVQAILEGRKTKTRRIIKRELDDRGLRFTNTWEDWHGRSIKCPYGEAGDIIWVRETWKPRYIKGCLREFKIQYPTVYPWFYAADGESEPGYGQWKPSIHMPKDACRLFLKIKSIKVERLHDISTEDILSEGVKYNVTPNQNNPDKVNPVFRLGEDNSALSFMPAGWKDLPEKQLVEKLLFAHWAELWCDVNGRANWDTNPWVWVIEFDKIEKPSIC